MSLDSDPLDNPVLQRDSARELAAILEERNEKALRLHPRSVLSAGVMAETRHGIPAGRCAYCLRSEPIRVYRDYLNGGNRKVLMHDHEATEPYCVTCTGPGYDTQADWPCDTVKALTGDDEDDETGAA